MEAVFDVVQQHTSVDEYDLREFYRDLVDEDANKAFADGRTSDDYRRARFTRLLQVSRAGLPYLVDDMLAVYAERFGNSLILLPGAVEFLRWLRCHGHQIAVITEGPEDAQQWTIERLGIAPFVDLLVTSNRYRLTKITGLFDTGMKLMSLHQSPIFYFGDSLDRDIYPAAAAGFRPVLVHSSVDGQTQKALEAAAVQVIPSLRHGPDLVSTAQGGVNA